MNINFPALVQAAFAKLLNQYNLRLCELSPSEILMVGADYSLLVWLDRDGISLHYLDLEMLGQGRTVDLPSYLVKKRRWIIGGRPINLPDRERDIQFGLNNCALTLMEVAQDILAGEKEWLADPSVEYSPLNNVHKEELALAITR